MIRDLTRNALLSSLYVYIHVHIIVYTFMYTSLYSTRMYFTVCGCTVCTVLQCTIPVCGCTLIFRTQPTFGNSLSLYSELEIWTKCIYLSTVIYIVVCGKGSWLNDNIYWDRKIWNNDYASISVWKTPHTLCMYSNRSVKNTHTCMAFPVLFEAVTRNYDFTTLQACHV